MKSLEKEQPKFLHAVPISEDIMAHYLLKWDGAQYVAIMQRYLTSDWQSKFNFETLARKPWIKSEFKVDEFKLIPISDEEVFLAVL